MASQTRLHADLRLLAQALKRYVAGLDNFVDERAPRVERDKRGFHCVEVLLEGLNSSYCGIGVLLM